MNQAAAEQLLELGRSIGDPANNGTSGDPVIDYLVHLSILFGGCNQSSEEFEFAKQAAELGKERAPVCQKLWMNAFEKALNVEKWEEAYSMLLKLDSKESPLESWAKSSGALAALSCC